MIEIITNLHEIPKKYNFLGGYANNGSYWADLDYWPSDGSVCISLGAQENGKIHIIEVKVSQ